MAWSTLPLLPVPLLEHAPSVLPLTLLLNLPVFPLPCHPRPVSSGERFASSSDPATRAAAAAIQAAEAEELAEKRRAKKAAFDQEYDEGGPQS